MSWYTKRLLRDKLVTCHFPKEQADLAKKQIEDILALHIARFSAHQNIRDQLEAAGFDCYVQGLLDGNQVKTHDIHYPVQTKEKS